MPSSWQVRASLGELHRAVDRAIPIRVDAHRDGHAKGGRGVETQERTASAAKIAPAPRVADLVFFSEGNQGH